MSPPRRRSTYKQPRNRRDVTIAVLSSLAIVVVTAVLVWVLRPNKDSGATPIAPATSVPVVTTAPTSPTAPTDTTAAPADSTPADSTPADTTPADSTPASETP
jgi:hypothetical protein